MKSNYVDISSELTVFIIYTNESTLNKCIKALDEQNSKFEIKIIKNIFPMSSAFQYMPDNCSTKYFIQLDADMIIFKDSILKLYLEIKKSNFFIYRISGQLFEEGFGIGGHIKCWKKYIFKFFKFKDVRTVDRSFHNSVRIFGFRNKIIEKIFGYHIPRYSKFSLYLKTKSDIEKWRFLKRPFNKYAEPLLKKIIIEKDLIKLNGFILGSISMKKNVIRSKNIEYELALITKINNNFKLLKTNKNFFNINRLFDLELIKKNYESFKKDNLQLKKKLLSEYLKLHDIKSFKIDIIYKILVNIEI